MPGWDTSNDWNDEIIPFEKNPVVLNPKEEFIATANNKHTKMIEEPYTGRDFIDGYRHRRVVNLIQSREKWLLDDVVEMQQDWYSGPWEDIKESVLKIKSTDKKAAKALSILSDWNGIMSSDSAATIIYEYFIAGMTSRIVSEIAGSSEDLVYETYNPAVGSACFAMSRISQVVQYLRDQPEDLIENRWEQVIEEELARSVEIIEKTIGEETDDWQWGDFRPLVLKHPINRNLKEYDTEAFRKKLSLGPIKWGGDEQTLNVAAGSMLDPTVTPDFIPNLRSVIEVGNWDTNYFSLAGGSSSNPGSKHYRDLFELWKDGKGIQISWSKEKVDEQTKAALIIKPKA